MPDWPIGSSAEPLRYQIMWVTTGTRWSGTTTTSRPLSREKDDTSGPPPSVLPNGAASVRSVAAPLASIIVVHLGSGGSASPRRKILDASRNAYLACCPSAAGRTSNGRRRGSHSAPSRLL